MRKKHGTVRDRFRRFGLFQPLNDIVQLFFFFFSLNGVVLKWLQHIFFSLNGVVLKWLQHIFFFPPIRRRSALSQNHFSETLSHFSITLNPHSSLPLSKITLKSSHSQVSISPSRCRTVAAQPLSLAPSHFVAQSLCHSLVALRSSASLPRRRHSTA